MNTEQIKGNTAFINATNCYALIQENRVDIKQNRSSKMDKVNPPMSAEWMACYNRELLLL
jgi:hypothetical protein